MNWLWRVSYFFGGAFAANAIPHSVSGLTGHPFQSPFAKPPGKGLSSSTVNVLWGFFNAVVAYLLVARVGAFDPRTTSHILAFALGALLLSLSLARHFGQFHGGNTPTSQIKNRVSGTLRSLRSSNFRLSIAGGNFWMKARRWLLRFAALDVARQTLPCSMSASA